MKKILLVENEQFLQKAVCGILSIKYEIVCAASESEAISLCARENPDLVLSELVMPQLSGPELQRELNERHERPIPFMFMADGKREENESLALTSGAMDYIGRPFKPETLLRRVENVMRQIDSLRQLQGLKIVAESDPMTGLLNKAFAHKTLAELCPRSCGVLMMIDLDDFKLVNDLYGHGMGDRVLVRFADILRGLVRSSDVVGRIGGDEFIVFCHDVRSERLVAEKSAAIGKQLLAASRELLRDAGSLLLGASVGAVFVPDEGVDFAELYKKADKALYAAKQNGKGRYEIYRGHGARAEAESHSSPSDLLREAGKILEERSRQNGALAVGFENFRTLYRFFIRVMENYHYDAEFVVFSFEPDAPEEAMDAFGELLHRTLRRSDVYTRSAAGRYLVLLPQPISDHGEAAIRRVLDLWSRHERYEPVLFEHEPIPLAE